MSEEKKTKDNKDKISKKAFIQDRLVEGEEVLAEAVISPFIYWHSVVVAIIGAVVYFKVVSTLGNLLFIVAGLMALYAAARKAILLLVVTNKRVLTRYGILQMDVVDLHFDKLESMELEQMPTGMIMGYHRIAIQGTGNRYISIPYVANAPAVRKVYNEISLKDK